MATDFSFDQQQDQPTVTALPLRESAVDRFVNIGWHTYPDASVAPPTSVWRRQHVHRGFTNGNQGSYIAAANACAARAEENAWPHGHYSRDMGGKGSGRRCGFAQRRTLLDFADRALRVTTR